MGLTMPLLSVPQGPIKRCIKNASKAVTRHVHLRDYSTDAINALEQWFSRFRGGDCRRKKSQAESRLHCPRSYLPSSHPALLSALSTGSQDFQWEKRFSSALTILAPISHDWFLLSLWSVFSIGFAHLLWHEFSLTFLFRSIPQSSHNEAGPEQLSADTKCVPEGTLLLLRRAGNTCTTRGSFRWLRGKRRASQSSWVTRNCNTISLHTSMENHFLKIYC